MEDTANAAEASQSADAGISELIDFARGFLSRQYWVLILAASLGLGGSVIYLRVTPPTYSAQVSILFANPKTEFVEQQSVVADTQFDNAQLETQIQLLKSKKIASAVIARLNLADDTEFKAPGPSLYQKAKAELRGRLHALAPWAVSAENQPQVSTSADAAVDAFGSRLSASRAGSSTVIDVSFSSSSPARAAEIANAVAEAYLNDQMEASAEASRIATGWLESQMNELAQQGVSAERKMNAYEKENNVVSTGGKLVDEQQVAELSSSLVAARTQTAAALARVGQFDAILNENNPAPDSIDNLDVVGSDASPDPIINTLRQQYIEYARREADWTARFGASHLAVVKLRQRMRETRTAILLEVKRLASKSRIDYELAKRREQETEQQLASAVARLQATYSIQVNAGELATSAKSYRQLSENYFVRYIGQQRSFPIPDARVISPATPPGSKSKPKTALILLLGLVGGVALGGAGGLLRETSDRVFRTRAQVEKALALPCLSLVPRLKKGRRAGALGTLTFEGQIASLEERRIVAGSGAYWAASSSPLSCFAESVREITLAIDGYNGGSRHRVVGITSAVPNEGKSTIACSLAQLIGAAGRRVIVVDCDLRNSSLSAGLAPHAAWGVVDVLSGRKSLRDCLWREPATNIDFLPAGRAKRLFHIADALSSDAMRDLFEGLRSSYDYVIVDLPPLIPIVDVRAISVLSDCLVLVSEWGKTRIEVVKYALATAPRIRALLVGVVLNKTNIRALSRYGGVNYPDKYFNDRAALRDDFVRSAAE